MLPRSSRPRVAGLGALRIRVKLAASLRGPRVEILFLEDLEVGLRMQAGDYRVSKEEVVSFASIWDPQPFHIDEEAARASVYGGLTACSAHIFAVFSKVSNMLPRRAAAIGALGFDELRIPQPLRAGDTVRVVSECIEVRRSARKPDRGIVTFHAQLLNQSDTVVFSAKSTVMVKSRAASPV